MFLAISSTCNNQLVHFVSHNTAEYYVAENDYISIAIRRRISFPTSYCTISPDGGMVLFGYGEQADHLSDEFLHCTATAQGDVTVRRDAMATLPLFFAVINGRLLLGNDYHELTRLLPRRTVSHDALHAMLTWDRSRPLLREIRVLYAQQTLHFKNGEVSITEDGDYIENSAQAKPTEPRQFAGMFGDYLDYFVNSRFRSSNVAFEVSGGLDSATLPQFSASHHQIQPLFATVLLADSALALSQQKKLSAIAQKVNARVVTTKLDYNTNFPLSRMIRTDSYYTPFGDHTYHEATLSYITQLRAAGVTMICTGHGGDELFGNYPTSRNIFQGVPLSTQKVKLFNNVYIEHDIWPVSPFMDPMLFRSVQGLPLYARSQRNILRAFHKANGYVEEIHASDTNEDFSSFIPECILAGRYDALLHELFTHGSLLHRLEIQDISLMHEKYQHIKAAQYSSKDALIHDTTKLYAWLMTEITARTLYLKPGHVSTDELFRL